MLSWFSDVDTSVHASITSSVPSPATTRRFIPALPWWTVLTWERRLSTRLKPRPHLSHKKGFSPERAKKEREKNQNPHDEWGYTVLLVSNYICLPVWMITCFDKSPKLTNALLHMWHLCGRTLSWCRMWLASWLDCTNLHKVKLMWSVWKSQLKTA